MASELPWRRDCPQPLEYFETLVAEDQGLGLLEAAASLAQDEHPELDLQGVLDEVDALARRLRDRVPADASGLHRIRLLHRYFFGELGFAGNVNHYHDPDNSYLHRVIQTRRGIPISLAVLYLELAAAAGLQAQGVSFPGHFLVKVRLTSGEVVVDPFTGESLSRRALEERLEALRGAPDADAPPLGLYLVAASPREVLARMLRNLKALHAERADTARQLAVQERMVRLLPDDWQERCERGLLRAEVGAVAPALEDLRRCLSERPDDPQAPRLRRLVDELGRPRPRRRP